MPRRQLLPDGRVYDVYGHRLSEEVARRFGLLERRNWYVKITLWEPNVMFLSLHRLDRTLRISRGAFLEPDW